ncbi:hypothetical protein [Noviherbaspirillum sp. Root189]|uniref:hypothetical protein n=1 Tax=Noviherbaspirillum sp. Root189 TaxID=1736487 RepID=UPI00070C9B57|nr:hypothetical protein [Noviherbaspirillum sp. Root189]KRB73470.1 hypothetical protein ASE07_06350 [Noviherbaspirillum sp. Root189]
MTADTINGLFEAFASLMILNHARVLYRDKLVRGISIVSVMFFFAWGVWNLYYYPTLGQMFSFWCGIAVVIANATWTGMLLFYSYRK